MAATSEPSHDDPPTGSMAIMTVLDNPDQVWYGIGMKLKTDGSIITHNVRLAYEDNGHDAERTATQLQNEGVSISPEQVSAIIAGSHEIVGDNIDGYEYEEVKR